MQGRAPFSARNRLRCSGRMCIVLTILVRTLNTRPHPAASSQRMRNRTLTYAAATTLAVVCAAASGACADEEAPPVCPDGAIALDIGETVEGALVPIDAEDEPTFVYGIQGGQHLALSARVGGMSQTPTDVRLTLEASTDADAESPERLGGFVRELDARRADAGAEGATWHDLWLVVDEWPLDQTRSVSATVELLPPCEGAATWELTLPPNEPPSGSP